jgi:steroid 5-alpha reductase family enzyme
MNTRSLRIILLIGLWAVLTALLWAVCWAVSEILVQYTWIDLHGVEGYVAGALAYPLIRRLANHKDI